MRFVIVTGMSGAGKSTALDFLEDSGYYCADNLPVPLIGKFVELLSMPDSEIEKVALGIDARNGQSLEELGRVLDELSGNGINYEVLFLESSDDVLIKRYKETRRAHPVNPVGRVEDGIAKERKILEQIKSEADYVIDTSGLLTRVLKEELIRIFVKNEEYNSLMISIMSFGFKNGIPADADLVFDVRFLPNPFYVESLKKLTGNDAPVRDYVMSFPEAGQFMDKLTDMISFLIPGYVKEGKNQLVIAIGCTGGQHRSVTIANALAARLRGGEYGINLFHRDCRH